jgi:hypothetical protein
MICQRWASCLLVVLVGVGAARADSVRGTITRVDLKNNKVTIEGRGRGFRGVTLRFHLDNDSRILLGRETGIPTDLTEGSRVLVRYELRDDVRVITLIKVRGALRARADGRIVTGTVRRVSPKDRRLVLVSRKLLGDEGADVRVELPENVRIMNAGKTVRLRALKEGTWLRLRREKRDGKWVVRSVQVVEGGPEALVKKMRAGLKIADFLLGMAEQRDEEGSFAHNLRQSLKYADLFITVAEATLRAKTSYGQAPAGPEGKGERAKKKSEP